MEITKEWVHVPVGDKEMAVYQTAPVEPGRWPAVILLQEIFGVNIHIRQVAARLAEEGYRVVAPDLFHRQGERLTAPYDALELARGRKAKLVDAEFVRDLEHLLSWLRDGSDRAPSSASVLGFCFGGRLAYLAAASLPLDAAVVFYGGGIAAGPIAKTADIRCPMLLFFGAKDTLIPSADVQAIEAALKQQGKKAEVIVYPEAGHGFFCNERTDYREEPARDAWSRTLRFLKGLGGRS